MPSLFHAKRTLIAALFILILLLLLTHAPGFLFPQDTPRRADAVVVFVGPGNESRLEEAKELIREGYARYLLIPSTGEIITADRVAGFVMVADNRSRGNLFLKIRIAANYRKYYENTHIEALEAKRMLDDLGLRSALLVSSAFHMRRIRIIAGRVFDARKYTISCTPARWQIPFSAQAWLDEERVQIIVSEYVKMAWFLAYGWLAGR